MSVAAGMPSDPTADFFPKISGPGLMSPDCEDRPLCGFGDATGSMGAKDDRELAQGNF